MTGDADIAMSIEIVAPVERVWEAIATEARLRDWLNADMRFEPRVGGRAELAGAVGDEPLLAGGRVVALEPPRRVAWEWAPLPPRADASALLTIALTAGEDAVRVELRLDGLERLREPDRAAARAFWTGDELIPLKELVEGVGPTY